MPRPTISRQWVQASVSPHCGLSMVGGWACLRASIHVPTPRRGSRRTMKELCSEGLPAPWELCGTEDTMQFQHRTRPTVVAGGAPRLRDSDAPREIKTKLGTGHWALIARLAFIHDCCSGNATLCRAVSTRQPLAKNQPSRPSERVCD